MSARADFERVWDPTLGWIFLPAGSRCVATELQADGTQLRCELRGSHDIDHHAFDAHGAAVSWPKG